MADSVRAARAAGVGIPASGWEKMPSEVWPHVAASIAGEWHPGAVKYHLRWWAARERLAGVSRPGRPALATLFGWGDRRLRDFMADPQTWDDDAAPRSSRGPARVQATSSEGPDVVQVDSDSTVLLEAKGPDLVQAWSRLGPGLVQTTSSRALVAETETEPKAETHKSAPAPAVADLFTPASQPDATTGEATGDTAPPPGAAAPLPASLETSSRRARSSAAAAPVDPADLERILTAWGSICSRTKRQADRIRIDGPERAMIARACARDGAAIVVRRLEYVASGGGQQAVFARGCIESTARPMQIEALLRDPARASAKNGGPSWVSSVDAEAADWMLEDKAAPDAGARARAVEAWANMTMRADWQRRNHFAPNRPECFGAGLYDRIDLADDLDEHTRRFHCYVAAGSQKVWLVNAERERFKAAWIETYSQMVRA